MYPSLEVDNLPENHLVMEARTVKNSSAASIYPSWWTYLCCCWHPNRYLRVFGFILLILFLIVVVYGTWFILELISISSTTIIASHVGMTSLCDHHINISIEATVNSPVDVPITIDWVEITTHFQTNPSSLVQPLLSFHPFIPIFNGDSNVFQKGNRTLDLRLQMSIDSEESLASVVELLIDPALLSEASIIVDLQVQVQVPLLWIVSIPYIQSVNLQIPIRSTNNTSSSPSYLDWVRAKYGVISPSFIINEMFANAYDIKVDGMDVFEVGGNITLAAAPYAGLNVNIPLPDLKLQLWDAEEDDIQLFNLSIPATTIESQFDMLAEIRIDSCDALSDRQVVSLR